MDTILKIIELLSKWSKSIPYFFEMISVFIAILLIATAIVVILRIRHGDMLEIPWLRIIVSPDKKYQQLKGTYDLLVQQFNDLNEDSSQKINIMKLLNSINEEIATLHTIQNPKDFMEKRELLLNFILNGIIGSITKEKDNYHRVAIFIPCKDDESKLKIYRSHGHSPTGQRELRLNIDQSVAGYVYRCKAPMLLNTLEKNPLYKPNEKASRKYESLLCVPIMTGNDDVWGVLSLDGEKANSFSDDDKDFLRYFAVQLAIIVQLNEYHESKKEVLIERGYDHGHQDLPRNQAIS